MNKFRRLASRGVLVPLALFALLAASSLPASAATLHTPPTVPHVAKVDSLNW